MPNHPHDAEAALQRAPEETVITSLIDEAQISADTRLAIQTRAMALTDALRTEGQPGLMESFLAEYGLSTNEGIALMCLAESLLRVPDPGTIDRLIDDKITPYDWDDHLGQSDSALVNASTVALMLTGRVLDDSNSASVMGLLHRTVKRLGEPVVRTAVKRAMQEMGDQFVLGQTIEEAIARGKKDRRKGFLYSYDMLGEAALTARDAEGYFDAYSKAVSAVGKLQPSHTAIADSPGISVKLSALHPRFEFAKKQRLMDELVPRLTALALAARQHNIGLNVDAEEADRLELTLTLADAVLRDARLSGWDGFGLVVQAYGKRASAVIDWLYGLARTLERKVMVRLVKGAYWDTEIKRAQIDGVEGFPVFTTRAATDISYICCAKKLLGMTDYIYPQFATHNAHTAAAILALCEDKTAYEFQRLHGMGDTLHNMLLEQEKTRCRIYAPVGPHKDLLAYLVRRLLENGANSSFVNQISDHTLTTEFIAADPFEQYHTTSHTLPDNLKHPTQLYAPARKTSKGWDLRNAADIAEIDSMRSDYRQKTWSVQPVMVVDPTGKTVETIYNPANPSEVIGTVTLAGKADAAAAIEQAQHWGDTPPRKRATILRHASDLFEAHSGEIFALLAREAGKTPSDAIAELREAVDFLRYYAHHAEKLTTEEPLGIVTCISPWNFPLAIFTGQIAAALAAGNAVIAKPAEATPIIASLAVSLLHEAGVPRHALQCLPGIGAEIGQALTSDPAICGVCFTGSTVTAQRIHQSMAAHAAPWAPLIAETGGLNAALMDSTALAEQTVRHTIESAFQSAGQRCSAMRALFLQEDIADGFLDMLFGAMDELRLGNPWEFDTDIGPVISAQAQTDIQDYIDTAKKQGRLRKQLAAPKEGYFVGPAVIELDDFSQLKREIFGPVLHIIRFASDDYDAVIDSVNRSGYGLTFGLHTRIDERIETIAGQLRVGNIYVNRNQIGAIVGSQPFGGEGLSGTGPKAGGPRYVQRFVNAQRMPSDHTPSPASYVTPDRQAIQHAIDHLPKPATHRLSSEELPGPTGELNELSVWPRRVILCLGPTYEQARMQARAAQNVGCVPLVIAPRADGLHEIDGVLDRAHLQSLEGFDIIALWSDEDDLRSARQALAKREGPIIPLVATDTIEAFCIVERHLCVDTTAAGGNASLLGEIKI